MPYIYCIYSSLRVRRKYSVENSGGGSDRQLKVLIYLPAKAKINLDLLSSCQNRTACLSTWLSKVLLLRIIAIKTWNSTFCVSKFNICVVWGLPVVSSVCMHWCIFVQSHFSSSHLMLLLLNTLSYEIHIHSFPTLPGAIWMALLYKQQIFILKYRSKQRESKRTEMKKMAREKRWI